MKCLAVSAFLLCVTIVVSQPRLLDLTLSDAPTNERGYLIATTVNTQGIAYTGPVCGEVDLLTAWIICINLGWLFTTGMSTTREFGIDPPTEEAILSNLTCTGFENNNGAKTFNCTFVQPPFEGCTADGSAAVSCYFTIGQIAGMAVGALLFCLLITIPPIVLCCICCCCCTGRGASE